MRSMPLLPSALLDLEALREEDFDKPLGTGSGAGVIFGTTGGVMEAALRTAYYKLEGHNPEPDAFRIVRGADGIRETTVSMGGITVKAAFAHGLGNARKLIEDIREGRRDVQFVEVMACPGGCVGGGGQPIRDGVEMAAERSKKLYSLNQNNCIRFSHENPDVTDAYDHYFGHPLSEKSHELLHTDHNAWKMPGEKQIIKKPGNPGFFGVCNYSNSTTGPIS